MEKVAVLLSKSMASRQRRRVRRDLSRFLEVISLYLEVGYDFASAWDGASQQIGSGLDPLAAQVLHLGEGESFSGHLEHLAATYPIESHRLWFSVFSELYGSGAAMKDIVFAAGDVLRKEHLREIDLHCAAYPRQAQILLLLFFLPPAFFLLFAPILIRLAAPW